MNPNSPSKKVIAFAIISLGIVLALFTSKFLKEHPEIFPSLRNKTVEEIPLQDLAFGTNLKSGIEMIDTDEDGLKDWEELLWSTDADSKDSDKDGTTDGDEVREGRNPTKAGPDDYLNTEEKTAVGNASAEVAPQKPLTHTDLLAESLVSKYMALKSASGGTVTEEAKNLLVENLVSTTENSFLFRQFTRGKMEVFSGEEKNNIRFYASSFATLQLNFLIAISKNELAIRRDPSVAARLYENLAVSLYLLKVPQAISTDHLIVVNNMSIASAAFDAFGKFKEDPLLTTPALNAYRRAGELQDIALANISEYLRKNDIIFTEDEAGSFWNDF